MCPTVHYVQCMFRPMQCNDLIAFLQDAYVHTVYAYKLRLLIFAHLRCIMDFFNAEITWINSGWKLKLEGSGNWQTASRNEGFLKVCCCTV